MKQFFYFFNPYRTTTWKRIGKAADRLYVETGASNPHLRSLLNCLETLSKDIIEVKLDDGGDTLVRLKVMSAHQELETDSVNGNLNR